MNSEWISSAALQFGGIKKARDEESYTEVDGLF